MRPVDLDDVHAEIDERNTLASIFHQIASEVRYAEKNKKLERENSILYWIIFVMFVIIVVLTLTYVF